MSKSLGNVIRIRDALKESTAAELRFYFASTHYREPMIYSQTGLQKSKSRLAQIRKHFSDFLAMPPNESKGEPSVRLLGYEPAFRRQMDDDFYTPGALEVIENFAKDLSRSARRLNQYSKAEAESSFRRSAGLLAILS
jgi:cysteinyl-tRNA synthetase